jgi:flagellar L-ring protein precursor FlgH
MIRYYIVVLAVYAICCAAAHGQPAPGTASPTRERPKERSEAAEREAEATSGGSMLRAGGSSMKYSSRNAAAVQAPQPRTIKQHDLVTIIVREESQSSSTGTTDLKKNADLDVKADSYLKLNVKNFAVEGVTPATTPELKVSGSRNLKGEAQVDRTDVLTARIGAEVVDVKPNGTLVLQAHKFIKTDDEEQEFTLTGTCRAEDVSPDNSVLSTTLHDLNVKKNSKGAARDTTKRGWIPRLLDFINPF